MSREFRLECLKLAASRTVTVSEAIMRAKEFEAYVLGSSGAIDDSSGSDPIEIESGPGNGKSEINSQGKNSSKKK